MVVAILALGAMVALPMIGDRIREARSKTAVSQYVVALRAARMVAIATGSEVVLNTSPETCATPDPCGPPFPCAPCNSFDYTDSGGEPRIFRMPDGIRIVSSSSPTTFRPNGANRTPSITVIESTRIEGPQDRVEVRVPASGIPQVIELGPGSTAPPS